MASNKSSSKAARGGKTKTMSEEQLSLEFIQDLGGTKDDLRLLADIDDKGDDEDLDLAAEDFDTEPIKKEDIHSFMKELGIFDHRPDTGKEPKKPKKLVSAPAEDDSDTKGSQSAVNANENEVKQKKKKEKNKFKLENKSEHEINITKPQEEREKQKKKKKEKNKFKVQHDEVSSTTISGEEELLNNIKTHPQRTYLLVKPGDAWLNEKIDSAAEETTKTIVHQCEQFAVKLLEDEVVLYKAQREKTKRGESNWIKTVLTSGTLTDKMAALTLLAQESPTHNMNALETLVTMARKKGKREAMLASDTLKNLFVSETSPLPEDRKLISFSDRPLSSLWQMCSGNKDNVDRHLMMWHAEDLLKQKYAAFVKALDVMSYDTLLVSKEKAIAIMHSLLTSRPEQEEVLLPMLVNKLGDPNHKIASKASYLLIKLVEEHPNMKLVIVKEVERLVYRSNVAQRAQYYAMCFLNQIRLHKADHALASQLIRIYFSFFKMYVQKGEVDSKMMAALLSGVNRAYPYAKLKAESLSEEIAPLYKIVHIVNINTSIQALMLLFHVIDPSNSDSDRYFMALYRKLLDPALRASAKQPQFLNLLYKSMKNDVVEKRVKAVLKRLLQTGSYYGPEFLCGALIVVSEVLKDRPNLLAVKQLCKIGENSSGIPGASIAKFDDDDEEERFEDLPLPPEFETEDSVIDKQAVSPDEEVRNTDNGEETEQQTSTAVSSSKHVSSWLHRKNLTGKSEQHGYDRYQRNPLHCHAQNECLWELQALANHYHPSVSLFANTILKGQPIEYPSDPLQDFTLIRFLDRFVYKNPKKKDAGEGKSETIGAASGKRGQLDNIVPVNSEEFIQRGEEAVPEHERYLYRYFSQRAEKKKKEKDEDSDAESVSDTEFDAFLDKYERQMDHDDLDEMDFGADFVKGIGGKKSSMTDSSDDDMDEDEGVDGGLSDEEIDFGDDEDDELAAEFRQEMEGLGDEEDEDNEDDDFSGDELKQMMASGSTKRSKKREDDFDMPQKKKTKRSRSDNLASMFAAADDFADVLEGNTDVASATMGTVDDVLTKDKASAKQIAWEADRDRKMRGNDWRQKKRGKFQPKGRKSGKQGHNSGKRPHKGQHWKKRK